MLPLAPFAVFSIRRPDRVEALLDGRGGTWKEGKRWTAAARLLEECRRRAEILPVLIADAAADTSRLLAWGMLDRLAVSADHTEIDATNFERLVGHRTQELLLLSTGRPIAEGFLRSYAIVHTPAFLGKGSIRQVAVRRPRAPPASRPTLFSFGYWGSGSGTARLVRAIDDAERARGFEPPLWVDIRINREVRAAGFSGRSFHDLVGDHRYRWVKELGNQRVAEGRGGVQLRDPSAVQQLLDLALEDRRRRVLFYCSCDATNASIRCHRFTVRDLLVKHARRKSVELEVVEWPGGEPWTFTVEASSPSRLRGKQIGMPPGWSESDAVAVPWGSHAILRVALRGAASVLVGPARFGKSCTSFPVLDTLPPGSTDGTSTARRWRAAHHCGACRS